jgi:hypothetical protein
MRVDFPCRLSLHAKHSFDAGVDADTLSATEVLAFAPLPGDNDAVGEVDLADCAMAARLAGMLKQLS